MKAYSTLLFLLLTSLLSAQRDSSSNILKDFSYGFDLGAGLYYQFTTFGNTNFNSVRIPEVLPRRIDDLDLRRQWGLDNDQVSDNPFFHGSYFINFGASVRFGEALVINGAINAEQRGFSDGVFSQRTRNFFPYFNATFAKKIGKFSYHLQAGDFRSFRLYEGLTFYNLDTQSWIFKFKYGNVFFRHAGIGDLLIGIGLGIDDLYDSAIGLEALPINRDSTLLLDFQIGYSNNRGSFGGGFWNFAGKIQLQENYSLYSQVSLDESGGSAFLFGLQADYQGVERLDLQTKIEYRSYQAAFNLGYENTVYYRDPAQFAGFTNSTHNVFIPLDFYERTFSQWAIFTEYQNQDVNGLNIYINAKYRFYKQGFFKTVLDFNWLITDEENFLYPFYQFGIGVEPARETEVSLEMTNRALNLDKNYPTLYASTSPYLILRLYRPLRFFKEDQLKQFQF